MTSVNAQAMAEGEVPVVSGKLCTAIMVAAASGNVSREMLKERFPADAKSIDNIMNHCQTMQNMDQNTGASHSAGDMDWNMMGGSRILGGGGMGGGGMGGGMGGGGGGMGMGMGGGGTGGGRGSGMGSGMGGAVGVGMGGGMGQAELEMLDPGYGSGFGGGGYGPGVGTGPGGGMGPGGVLGNGYFGGGPGEGGEGGGYGGNGGNGGFGGMGNGKCLVQMWRAVVVCMCVCVCAYVCSRVCVYAPKP